MGIISALMGNRMANKSEEAFAQLYREQCGYSPSSRARELYRSAITVISSFVGAGRDELATERLAGVIDDYAREVNRNENAMLALLMVLMAYSSKSNGTPALGCGWVHSVINLSLMLFCPNTVNDLMSRY